jgi:hypothetical protein
VASEKQFSLTGAKQEMRFELSAVGLDPGRCLRPGIGGVAREHEVSHDTTVEALGVER